MILKCLDGPMDGAAYSIASMRGTERMPDGLWFDAQDEHGRDMQHQYAYDRDADYNDHVTLCYRYTGPLVDTGLEMETARRTDWRVGLKVTPKRETHHLFGLCGVVESVHGPVIVVRVDAPNFSSRFEEHGEDWVVA